MLVNADRLAEIIDPQDAERVWELARQWRWGILTSWQRKELADYITNNHDVGVILGQLGITPGGVKMSYYAALFCTVFACQYDPTCPDKVIAHVSSNENDQYCSRHRGLLNANGDPQEYAATMNIRFVISEETDFNAFVSEATALVDRYFGTSPVYFTRKPVSPGE